MSLERWAESFWLRRKAQEKHTLDRYYVHGPLTNLVQTLASGFVRGYYYMSEGELIQQSILVHKGACLKDPEFHVKALLLFRHVGFVKDQVVIGLAVRNALPDDIRRKWELWDLEVLKTLPPNLMHRLAQLLRKTRELFGAGLSSRMKRLMGKVMREWASSGLLEYYAIRYPGDMRDLVRLVHPTPVLEEARKIYGWLVAKPSRRKAPTEAIRAYEEARRRLEKGDLSRETWELMETYRLPAELIRSHLPLRYVPDTWRANPPDYVLSAIEAVSTASFTVLNLRLLARLIGDEHLAGLVEEKVKGGRVSSFDVARAGIAVARELPRTYQVLDGLFKDKVRETLNEVLLPRLKRPEVTVCLDVSGSMFWRKGLKGLLFNSLVMLACIRKLVKGFVVFSDDAYEEYFDVETLSDIQRLYDEYERKYSHGTNLAAGVDLAVRVARREGADTLMIFSDEQENATHKGEQAAEKLRRAEVKVFVVNPSPYPCHAIPTKLATFVPAATPETMKASLTLSQTKRLTEEESREYVLRMVEVVKKKAKKKVQT